MTTYYLHVPNIRNQEAQFRITYHTEDTKLDADLYLSIWGRDDVNRQIKIDYVYCFYSTKGEGFDLTDYKLNKYLDALELTPFDFPVNVIKDILIHHLSGLYSNM